VKVGNWVVTWAEKKAVLLDLSLAEWMDLQRVVQLVRRLALK